MLMNSGGRGGIQTLDTNVDDIRKALLQRIIGPVDLWMPLLESYELSQYAQFCHTDRLFDFLVVWQLPYFCVIWRTPANS